MDVNELATLLKSKTEVRRSWRCPDENLLAAYLNRQLANENRQRLERHFADCTACLQTIGFLASHEASDFSVPPQLLASARALVSSRSPGIWRWRWAMATAAACLLVVTTFVILKSRMQPVSKSPVDFVAQKTEPIRPSVAPAVTPETERHLVNQQTKPSESRVPKVRGGSNALQPGLIIPRDGSVVRGGAQRLQWNAVSEASFYEVKVVKEDGSPVLSERTSETQLELKTDMLTPGKYFITVVAHLPGDRSVRSASVSFRVVGS